MSSVNERIEKLTKELKAAIEKHNEALQIVNTEKENAFGLQKQLEVLGELKVEEEGPAETVETEVA